MAHYLEHYDDQVGCGISRVYSGAPLQRGNGIGSFLGGLFRRVIPILKSGARVLGKEALRTGVSVMEDMDANTPFKEALKKRVIESGHNLKRKATEKLGNLMKGSGYKALRGGPRGQLLRGRGAGSIGSRRKGVKKSKLRKKKPGLAGIKKKKITLKRKKKKKKKSCCGSKRRRTVADIFGAR